MGTNWARQIRESREPRWMTCRGPRDYAFNRTRRECTATAGRGEGGGRVSSEVAVAAGREAVVETPRSGGGGMAAGVGGGGPPRMVGAAAAVERPRGMDAAGPRPAAAPRRRAALPRGGFRVSTGRAWRWCREEASRVQSGNERLPAGMDARGTPAGGGSRRSRTRPPAALARAYTPE